MQQLLPLLVVFAVVAVASWWYRRANGAVRAADATFTPDEFRALGLPPRRRSLLLFTAPACASCAAAKRVLDGLSDVHGVAVVAADVTEHAAIAASQHIYRAPTTVVVDERGRAIARVSGVPRDGELDQVLAPARAAAR